MDAVTGHKKHRNRHHGLKTGSGAIVGVCCWKLSFTIVKTTSPSAKRPHVTGLKFGEPLPSISIYGLQSYLMSDQKTWLGKDTQVWRSLWSLMASYWQEFLILSKGPLLEIRGNWPLIPVQTGGLCQVLPQKENGHLQWEVGESTAATASCLHH